jgi:hypothetical protein
MCAYGLRFRSEINDYDKRLTGFYEHGNKPLNSIQWGGGRGNFLNFFSRGSLLHGVSCLKVS